MKKYQIVLAVTGSVIVLLWIIGRATNMLQYFSVPTSSNRPTFKTGSHFFASNLITPKRFDFICYRMTDPNEGAQIWFHRICGMPGDTLEIRQGDLFINGINQDRAFNLKKMYTMPKQVAAYLDFDEEESMWKVNDSITAAVETIKQSAIIQQAKRFLGSSEVVPEIKKLYGHEWTANNFGPYVVPANAYFVMGDNRELSQDSRYTGPVDKSRYVATVIK